MDAIEAIKTIKQFQSDSLSIQLARIERSVIGGKKKSIKTMNRANNISSALLDSVQVLKEIVGQINVINHAGGIMLALPNLLDDGEEILSVSLGAGNTGRKFDLETNLRVAEFKFINWRGGAEAIRQNSIFKDFFELAEYESDKSKYLYVMDTEIPLKFFNGRRAIDSILSRNQKIATDFATKYGDNLKVVRDYYLLKKDEVKICDVRPFLRDM